MSFELATCLVTLFVLAGVGTPIGYSILLASIVYLGVAGLDVALAGEKVLQGFYKSTILLAVPLFIVAANIMNAGSITDRLLNFCVAAVARAFHPVDLSEAVLGETREISHSEKIKLF